MSNDIIQTDENKLFGPGKIFNLAENKDLVPLQDKASEATIGSISPGAIPFEYVQGESPTVEPSQGYLESAGNAITAAGAGFAKTVAPNVRALMLGVAKQFQDVDVTHNPYQNPEVLAMGPEFIAKYGEQFIDSPNANWDRGIIKRIKESDELDKQMALSPNFGMFGMFNGVFTDPGVAVPMFTPTGIIAKMGAGAVQGGVFGAELTLAQSMYDPNISSADLLPQAAAGAALTTGLFMLGAGISSASTKTKDFVHKVVNTDIERAKGIGADAIEGDVKVGEIIKSNPLFNATLAITKWLSPETRLLTSTNQTARTEASKFMESQLLTKNEMEGSVTKKNILGEAETKTVNQVISGVINPLEKHFSDYKKSGGSLSKDDFIEETVKSLEGLKKPTDPYIVRLSGDWRSTLDVAKKDIESTQGYLAEGATLKDNYFPARYDEGKMAKNSSDLSMDLNKIVKEKVDADFLEVTKKLEDIKNQIKSGGIRQEEKIAAVEDELRILRDIKDSPEELRTMAYDLQNTIMDKSLGRPGREVINLYKSPNLKARNTDIPNWFRNKWSKGDKLETLFNYFSGTNKELSLYKEYGSKNHLDVIHSKIQQEHTQKLADLQASSLDKASKDIESNKLIKEYNQNKEDLQAIYELATGNFNKRDNRGLRSFAAVMKGYNHMRLMGLQVVGNLSDIAGLAANKFFKSPLGTEVEKFTKGLADDAVFFKDSDEYAVLGVMSTHQLSRTRSAFFSDLENGTTLTKAEKGSQAAVEMFNKVNLFSYFNDALYRTAADGLVKKVMAWGLRKSRGEMLSADEALELTRMGFSDIMINKVVKQFESHHTIEKLGNKDVVMANIESWDSNVLFPLMGKLQAELHGIIMNAGTGSKPLWMSRAMGSMMSQFLGFTLASIPRLLLPRLQRISGISKTHSIQATMTIMSDVLLGATAGVLRSTIGGESPTKDTVQKALVGGFERSATLAMLSYPSMLADRLYGAGFASMVHANKHSKFANIGDASSLFLGPTGGLFNDAYKVSKSFKDGTLTDAEKERALRLLPGANLMYWYPYVNNISK